MGEIMKRTCGRCGLKDDIKNMHYMKKFKKWHCNDREACTRRLYEKK